VQSWKVLLMSAACLSKFLKLSNKQHMGSFYALTWKKIAYKYCIRFAKNWISVPNIVTLSLRCKYSRSNFQDAINSIRRSAATSDGKPLTSVFYDVICLESVRRRLNMLIYTRPFLTVFGEFEPQNVVGHRVGPKKALPYVTTRVLSHRAWNSMHGLLK